MPKIWQSRKATAIKLTHIEPTNPKGIDVFYIKISPKIDLAFTSLIFLEGSLVFEVI